MEEEFAFLTSVLNDNEADIIESILNLNGIPLLRKHQGTGAYLKIYMGMSNFGVDLYVPRKELEKVRNIIENNNEISPENSNEVNMEIEEDNVEDSSYQDNSRKKIWLIILLLFLPIVISIIASIIQKVR